MVALAVDSFLPPEALSSVGFIGNIGNGTLRTNAGTDVIGVVAFVGDDNGAPLKSSEQRLGAGGIMVLPWRDQEADRTAFRVDPRVDLRGETSPASPHTTISTLFFTPEAC